MYIYIYTCTYISISAAPCLASSDSRERSLCRLWRCQCRWSDVSETGIEIAETLRFFFFGVGKKIPWEVSCWVKIRRISKENAHIFSGTGGASNLAFPLSRYMIIYVFSGWAQITWEWIITNDFFQGQMEVVQFVKSKNNSNSTCHYEIWNLKQWTPWKGRY